MYTKAYPGGFQTGAGGGTPWNATTGDNLQDGIATAHDLLENLTTGHRHDGTGSRKVRYSDLAQRPNFRKYLHVGAPGQMAVANNVLPFNQVWPDASATLQFIVATAKTAPAGASLKINPTIGGTRIFNAGSEASIAAGSGLVISGTPQNKLTPTQWEIVQVDVVAVGTTTPGADVLVVFVYEVPL